MTPPNIIPRGIPFAQIPDAVIYDTRLSASEVRVYCTLMSRANSEGRSFPGQRRMAVDLGMSTNTVSGAIAHLEELGWVSVIRSRAAGRQAVNQYIVNGEAMSGRGERDRDVAVSATGDVAVSATELHPALTTSKNHIAAPPRNQWWDALVSVFGEPSNGQRALYGRVATLVSSRWEPSEIPTRAARLAELWGPEKVTVASLEKHWSRFDAAIGGVTASDVEAFSRERGRAETIRRLSDDTG